MSIYAEVTGQADPHERHRKETAPLHRAHTYDEPALRRGPSSRRPATCEEEVDPCAHTQIYRYSIADRLRVADAKVFRWRSGRTSTFCGMGVEVIFQLPYENLLQADQPNDFLRVVNAVTRLCSRLASSFPVEAFDLGRRT